LAIKKDNDTIKTIENPTEKVQLQVIDKDLHAILYIMNPTKKALITALLKLLQDGDMTIINIILNKFSNRNYPEFDIIKKSIEVDK